jgi:type III pantothenate kinase
VKEILKNLIAEMKEEPLVIATGGDAALIAAGVPEIQVVDPQVTLKGLHWMAVHHFSLESA